jgi:periplasmic protein TonB
MHFFSPIVLAVGLLAFAGGAYGQSGKSSNDSSAVVASGTPAEDPAFAAFLPVTKDIKPPKATSAPDPKYPDIPADAEPQGTVVLLIGINAKGHVEPVRVLHSDEPAFEKTAVDTVKKWKFKPAEKSGHAVPVQVTVEMKFQR